MKKTLSVICLILIQSIHVFSQSNPIDKKMEKVYNLVEKGKYKDASEQLEKLLEDYPEFGKGWDYLSKLRYKEYTDAKKTDLIFSGNVKVTTKDKDGKEKPAESDSMSNALMTLLTNYSPSKIAYSKYLYSMRQGLLTSDDAYLSSAIIRNIFVDPETDTAVSKKALKFFNEAEEEFAKKNYDNAAKIYKRAIEEQPDFFKASLYMGDCFYFTENYTSASEVFRTAVATFPNLLEPRKYLIDSYAKQRLYDKCMAECIQAMLIYPDLSVAVKLEDAVYYQNKKMSIKWTPRKVFPNQIPDSSKVTLNLYKPEKAPKVKEPWTYYQKAFDNIKPFCNLKGIITKPNSLTTGKYLEVYSWEEMLKNSQDPSLDQARKMQDDGYLDCYVLITCFHFDVYDQYLDFVSKRKDKVLDYYKKYIITR